MRIRYSGSFLATYGVQFYPGLENLPQNIKNCTKIFHVYIGITLKCQPCRNERKIHTFGNIKIEKSNF